MNNFHLKLHEGHPIIEDGGNIILIDTGAPSTIHSSSSIDFNGSNYSVTANYMGLTTEELSKLLGCKVTTLLGMDILSTYQILLDYENEQVSFSKEAFEFEGEQAKLDSFMGIPIIELQVEGKALRFFLDSGAKLSYLPTSVTERNQSIGKGEDFYPGFGEFTTPIYQIETLIGKDRFFAQYGNLPPMLQLSLQLGNCQGIMGYDFFKNFQALMDFRNCSVRYKQHIKKNLIKEEMMNK